MKPDEGSLILHSSRAKTSRVIVETVEEEEDVSPGHVTVEMIEEEEDACPRNLTGLNVNEAAETIEAEINSLLWPERPVTGFLPFELFRFLTFLCDSKMVRVCFQVNTSNLSLFHRRVHSYSFLFFLVLYRIDIPN